MLSAFCVLNSWNLSSRPNAVRGEIYVPKATRCHPEPRAKDLLTVQTNVICAQSKKILRQASE